MSIDDDVRKALLNAPKSPSERLLDAMPLRAIHRLTSPVLSVMKSAIASTTPGANGCPDSA